MKKTIKYYLPPVLALLLAVCVSSCHRRELDADERVTVRFVIGDLMTKAGDIPSADEQCINRWALLVFDTDGRRVAEGLSMDGSGIDAVLDAGVYTVCAVVNGVQSFSPADYDALSALEQEVVSLEQNMTSSLVMFGKQSLSLSGGDNGTKSITVHRLVSKVGIRSIRVDDSGELAGRSVVMKAIYLTNVVRSSRLGSDVESEALPLSRGGWYNTLGLHGGEAPVKQLDKLLYDGGIDETVSAASPYTSAHYFYPFPNTTALEGDSNASTWSRRCTRLVVEAAIDGTVYYYPVTLPLMQRNHTYIISQAVIRRIGSLDPEGREGSAMDVTWSVTSEADWDVATSITEES